MPDLEELDSIRFIESLGY